MFIKDRTFFQDLDEDTNYEQQIAYLKSYYPSPTVVDLKLLQQSMFVLPVPFAKYHKEMLAHTKELMEYQNGAVAINPEHDKLITALMTAVEDGNSSLQKEETSHSDVFDAFRMSLQFWH